MRVHAQAVLLSTLASAIVLTGCAAGDSRLLESSKRATTQGGCVVQTDVRSRFRSRSAFNDYCIAYDSVADLAHGATVRIQRGSR